MTNQELKDKFAKLYSLMANSKKVSNMKLFGRVMTEMMNLLIVEHPDLAESFINKLCAVKWRNYLTMDEAQAIIDRMSPAAKWDYDTWSNTMESIGAEVEKKPCYNEYALWVVMNMVYSDSAKTIAGIMGSDLQNVSITQLLNAVYHLALDKLCDEDEVFNIRSYFSL